MFSGKLGVPIPSTNGAAASAKLQRAPFPLPFVNLRKPDGLDRHPFEIRREGDNRDPPPA
jgi:hypothetical protein